MEGQLSAGPQKADKDEENRKVEKETPRSRIETDAIHVGQEPERWPGHAVIPPISMATTFKQPEPGKPVLYEYSRCGNPTRQCLEECLASLEKAKYALTFASGLGATTTLMFILKSGDHILSIDDVYGGTGRLFRFVHCRSLQRLSFTCLLLLQTLHGSNGSREFLRGYVIRSLVGCETLETQHASRLGGITDESLIETSGYQTDFDPRSSTRSKDPGPRRQHLFDLVLSTSIGPRRRSGPAFVDEVHERPFRCRDGLSDDER